MGWRFLLMHAILNLSIAKACVHKGLSVVESAVEVWRAGHEHPMHRPRMCLLAGCFLYAAVCLWSRVQHYCAMIWGHWMWGQSMVIIVKCFSRYHFHSFSGRQPYGGPCLSIAG